MLTTDNRYFSNMRSNVLQVGVLYIAVYMYVYANKCCSVPLNILSNVFLTVSMK